MLAGCTAYDRTKDQFTQPVVKDVKKGMTRSQVAAIAGKPSSKVTMIHAKGTCQTYILGQRNGKAETYFLCIRKSYFFARIICPKCEGSQQARSMRDNFNLFRIIPCLYHCVYSLQRQTTVCKLPVCRDSKSSDSAMAGRPTRGKLRWKRNISTCSAQRACQPHCWCQRCVRRLKSMKSLW